MLMFITILFKYEKLILRDSLVNQVDQFAVLFEKKKKKNQTSLKVTVQGTLRAVGTVQSDPSDTQTCKDLQRPSGQCGRQAVLIFLLWSESVSRRWIPFSRENLTKEKQAFGYVSSLLHLNFKPVAELHCKGWDSHFYLEFTTKSLHSHFKKNFHESITSICFYRMQCERTQTIKQ